MSHGQRHWYGWTVGTIVALTVGVPAPGGQSVVVEGTQDDGARNASLSSAVGASRDRNRDRLPPELEGRARIVRPETQAAGHVPAAPGVEATKSTPRGAVVSAPHDGTAIIRVLSDEAKEHGMVAERLGKAPIFFMDDYCRSDYSYAVLFMDDSEGNLTAQRISFGNGYVAGQTEIVEHDLSIFVSLSDLPDDGLRTTDVTLELWDGDPVGAFDIECSSGGVPAPIPNTLCTFSGLLRGYDYYLECPIPKTVVNCDHVFQVLHVVNGCQVSANIPCVTDPNDPTEVFTRPPDIGDGNGWEVVYACEQNQSCATANGYYSGVCCEDNSITCDHTDGTQECFQMRHCGDNITDSFSYTYDAAPPTYYNFIGGMFANANVIMQVTPMSVDAPPPNIPADVTISGNDVTIDQHYPGGIRHLWFELYVSDWDPSHTGLKLKAWQAGIDASGYQAGILCGLTPWRPACNSDADCMAALGPQGWGALAGGCNMPGMPPNVCMAGWANDTRTDFIFYNLANLGGVDQSTLNYRYGATLLRLPIPNPHIGNMFLGSLALTTDCDCPKGDFQVKVGLPNVNTNMIDEFSQFIKLLGVVPANIHFPTGQCCNLDDPNPLTRCLSDTVTRCECEQLGIDGGFDVDFDPTKTCENECNWCQVDEDCNDSNACTTDWCQDQRCGHRALTGMGCDDDNLCTENDRCANGVCAGVPTFDDAQYCCYPGDGTLCGLPSDPPGDFDGDGDVDLSDFAEFQNCFGSAPITGSCNGVDLTCDCAVDASDVDDFVSAVTGP